MVDTGADTRVVKDMAADIGEVKADLIQNNFQQLSQGSHAEDLSVHTQVHRFGCLRRVVTHKFGGAKCTGLSGGAA